MIKLLLLFLCLSSVLSASQYVVKTFETNKKEIVLSFDDGPKKNIHMNILTTLDFFNVKASFFLLGTEINKYPDLALKTLNKGHSLGNHSYSHGDFSTLNKKEVIAEISESKKIFHDILGESPSYFRAPYGRMKSSQEKWLKPYFKKVIKSNIEPEDWKESNSSEAILNHIIESASPGAIIVLPETKRTVTMLPRLITTLKMQGYHFVTIAEALNK